MIIKLVKTGDDTRKQLQHKQGIGSLKPEGTGLVHKSLLSHVLHEWHLVWIISCR